MINRCIHLFPEIKEIKIIERIRQKFDPLFGLIPPHITLVFPFQSDFSTEELIQHLNITISEISSFDAILEGITEVESFGFYLYLNVLEGSEQISELHQELYGAMLKNIRPNWLDSNCYTPHITVGKLSAKAELREAHQYCKNITQKFNTRITKVVIETILDNEESQIEYEFELK